MKNIIEARDSKVAELDQLVEELDAMDAGEEFDAKSARDHKSYMAKSKILTEKLTKQGN